MEQKFYFHKLAGPIQEVVIELEKSINEEEQFEDWERYKDIMDGKN